MQGESSSCTLIFSLLKQTVFFFKKGVVAGNSLWPATVIESLASINFQLGDKVSIGPAAFTSLN